MKFRFALLISWVAFTNLQAQKPDKQRDATIRNFKQDIEYLASDELQGRLTGWPGEEQSARYIAGEFAKLKLQPAGDNGTWYQKFDIVKLRLAGGKSSMHATLDDQVHTFPLNKEFYPLSASVNQAIVEAPLVFLGYGIAADSLGHNDYKDKAVKGKIAVIRLGAPIQEGKNTKAFHEHATMDKKLQLAVKAGAVGVIFIPETGAKEHPSGELKRDASMQAIPVVYALAYTDFLEHATKASIQVDITVLTGPGHNVLGYKQNKKAKYTVVIGAHHDHLGFGELGGSRAPGVNEIHNGADDNASGTAAMLQLARYISSNKKLKKYNYLFMAFSGEELGLLGSKFFVQHPTLPVANMAWMLNIDMLGRMDPVKKTLMVNGTGTSPLWQQTISKLPQDTLVMRIVTSESGLGPSDHASFYLQDIPVLHFFTGQHDDYHKPSDDAHKINYPGMYEAYRYMVRFIEANAKAGKPAFTKTKDVSPGRTPFKVSMGVMPDYSFAGPGMRLDGVTEGKPAAGAGLQKGDIIVSIGDDPVITVSDYMACLQKHNKGDKVQVGYIRAGATGTQYTQVVF